MATELGDSNDDRVFVHIETDELGFDRITHGPVLPVLALSRNALKLPG